MYVDLVGGINGMRQVGKKVAFNLPFFLQAPNKIRVLIAGRSLKTSEDFSDSMDLGDIEMGKDKWFVAGGCLEFLGTPLKIISNPYHDRDEYLKIKIDDGVFGYFNIYEGKSLLPRAYMKLSGALAKEHTEHSTIKLENGWHCSEGGMHLEEK